MISIMRYKIIHKFVEQMELQAYDEVDICMDVYIDDDHEYNQLTITIN